MILELASIPELDFHDGCDSNSDSRKNGIITPLLSRSLVVLDAEKRIAILLSFNSIPEGAFLYITKPMEASHTIVGPGRRMAVRLFLTKTSCN